LRRLCGIIKAKKDKNRGFELFRTSFSHGPAKALRQKFCNCIPPQPQP